MLKLEIDDSSLCCRDGNESQWALDVPSIVLIAEYTTNEGPYLDDYFVVFVAIEDGKAVFCRCTFYVEGRDHAMQLLHERFGIVATFGLCASTEWSSRVMWPIHLAEQDYFTFSEVRPSRISSKLYTAILGQQLEYTISEPVQDYVAKAIAGKTV